MPTLNALDIALKLYRQPALARKVRRNGLPPRMLSVIKIAAGSEEELVMHVDHTPEESREIREAAIFFLHNSLFQFGSDNYRVLGVEQGATVEQMREHKRWLLKWLHPDLNRNKWESNYLHRVLAAWQEIAGGASALEPRPLPDELRQGPRRSPSKYYRHRFPNYNAAPFKLGRIIRKTAIIFVLSFVVFLTLRQFHGGALTNFFQNFIYRAGT